MTAGALERPTGAPFRPATGLDHPNEALGSFTFLRRLVRNPLETWPKAFFTEDVIPVRVFNRTVHFVTRPDLVEDMLVTRADLFPKAPIVQRAIGGAVGEDSIFTAHGAQWRWQRRASAPAFRHDKILGFTPAMTRAAQAAVAGLGPLPARTEVDMAEIMMATTFDIIVETMLSGRSGLDAPRFGAEISRYFGTIGWVAATTVLGLPKWFPYPGKRAAGSGNRYLKVEMLRIIAERRARPSPTPDLLDLMIAALDPEDGRAMDDMELANNLLTFVVAGHETTALALTWAFWLIAQAPEVEAKLLAEIAHVAGEAPVGADHVDGLVYARQVVQEAMRLYPPAPMLPRVTAEALRLGDLSLPAGAPVYAPIYAIHRHEKLLDDPTAFDPDRFQPDKVKARPRAAYLPFGAGPRICIGASFALIEAVIILATVIRAVKIEAVPGRQPKPVTQLTLRPQGGMPLIVSRR